jgi:hypothetical protein
VYTGISFVLWGDNAVNLARSTHSYTEFEENDIQDIVVRSYTIVGKLVGIGQSYIQIEAREAIVPDRNLMDYSVRFELSTGGDYPQEAFASISYNDISKFLSVLNKLEMTSIKRDRFSFSEVQYEINDIKVIVFNNDRGDLMVALTCGGVSIHLSSVSKLANLRALVEEAKSHLDRHKLS